MTMLIIHTTSDGEIWLTEPNRLPFPYGDPPLPGESEEYYLDRHAIIVDSVVQGQEIERQQKLVTGKSVRSTPMPAIRRCPNIDHTELPDLYFQEAWTHDGKEFGPIDMKKAKVVHFKKLMNKKIVALSKTVEVVKRKRLRELDDSLADIVNEAITPEQLKAITHPDLEN